MTQFKYSQLFEEQAKELRKNPEESGKVYDLSFEIGTCGISENRDQWRTRRSWRGSVNGAACCMVFLHLLLLRYTEKMNLDSAACWEPRLWLPIDLDRKPASALSRHLAHPTLPQNFSSPTRAYEGLDRPAQSDKPQIRFNISRF